MSINHVGGPLCIFACMGLSLFSRPKIDRKFTKPSIVSIRVLPFCPANLEKYTNYRGFISKPGLYFQNFKFVEINENEAKIKTIVRCQKATSLSNVHIITQLQPPFSYTD